LELGFTEELEELLRFVPTSRQTLLFSATMTKTLEQAKSEIDVF
jgi:superfamily II DNA/RNA helicase